MLGISASMDTATKENLEDLVKLGEALLQKPVSKLNHEPGDYEPILNAGTNDDALIG